MQGKNIVKSFLKTLETNPKFKVLKVKKDNQWEDIPRSKLFNNIQNCILQLKDRNIEKGDRVAYKGNNSLEWISWNMACNSLGIIWVPIYTNQPYQYTEHVIKDCTPSLVISDDNNIFKIHGKLRQISNQITHNTVFEGITDFKTNHDNISNII